MFKFISVTVETIKIVAEWTYDGFVKSVYVTPYFESIKADKILKGPDGCDGFIAYIDGSIAGLLEFYFEDDIMELGIALNPIFIGKGLGKEFIRQGIIFGIEKYNYNKKFIKLSVNEKNIPAIKAYQKAGFSYYKKNGDIFEMRKEIEY